MPEVLAREKELRFTRSGQAVVFWMLAAVFGVAGIILFSVSQYRPDNPLLPHPLWSLAPLLSSYGLARFAWRLTRHAYLILTPLGLDVFPFFRPAKGMQTVFWSEIHAMDVDEKKHRLTLHFDAAKSSGIHLSLRPVDGRRRDLLIRAVSGRVSGTRS